MISKLKNKLMHLLNLKAAKAICVTCNGTQKIDFEREYPVWPNKYGEAPNQIICIECPDCTVCVQCAHPDYDGIHSCRKFGFLSNVK